MLRRCFSNIRRIFIAVCVIMVLLACFEVYAIVKSRRNPQLSLFFGLGRTHRRRLPSNELPPSAPRKSEIDSACFPHGTNILASKDICVCLKGWHGEGCSVPQAVWDSPGFQAWYAKGQIKRRLRPRTIVNALVFNHELDLLEIRVHELGDTVDYFLACEANFTYFGSSKPLRLRSNLSAGFLPHHRHKVVTLELQTHVAGDGSPWAQETYIRSSIWKKGRHLFKNLKDDDLFMILDADEIPSRDVMLFLKYHDGFGEPIALNLRWFLYGFFWENNKPVNVGGICSMAYLRDVYLNDSNLVRRNEVRAMRVTPSGTGTVWIPWTISGTAPVYAGWHCSWCFDVVGIQVKLMSAQRDDGVRWGDIAAKRDAGYINSLRRSGRYFDESPPLRKIDGYKAAPSYLRSDTKRWRYLLSL